MNQMSNWTPKEKSTGELSVTIEGDAWKEACRKAFNKIAANVTVEGFRKGHAPKELIEKRVPQQECEIQAIEDNANHWLQDGLKEHELEPISRPQMDIKSVSEEKAEVLFTFAVSPEVKLGEYKGLPYKLEDVTVDDKEFNAEIDRLREQYADYETKDGAAEKGDTVNINYEGFKDGTAFEGGKADNYNLVLGSGSFIPGFEDQLIGVKANEEKEISLKFPEDYHAEDLKGKDVIFKVKVNEVKKKVLPEVDDEFAKDVNAPGVDTADGLKKLVRDRLEEQKKNSAVQKADAEILDKVAANATVDVPDVLVEEEVTSMMNELAQKIQQYGMDMKTYLGMMGKKQEDLRKDYEEDARKAVKLRLVLEAIAKQEKLEPKDEDLEKEYQNIADQYKLEVAKVKSLIDPDYLKKDLKNRMAYDFVKENAAK
jgi:trigger factor